MSLSNKNILIFVDNNYQELEFWYPLLRMKEAGAKVVIVGAKAKSTYKSKHGYEVTTDESADNINMDKFDAIIIPGGYAPDIMRINQSMLKLVRQAVLKQNKVVAAICHAPWVLVSAQVLKGKNATCYHTIKDDLMNAGAHYQDKSVVVDSNIITSRQPDDLPDFCKAIIHCLQS